MKCPKKIWHSCILAVFLDDTTNDLSHISFAFPPPLPKKQIE